MLKFRKHAKELRLLLAVAAGGLAVASMMAGAMSLALFTDQQTVNNSFTAGTIALSRDLRGEWTRVEAARPDHGSALDRLPVAQGDAALGQRRDAHAEPGFHAGRAQRLFD